MSINIQRNQKKRVVIVGGGLGGLRLAEDLYGSGMQVVLIDKNNFHQFPPLIYQIASAGIDPSSISFPFRQIFRKRKDFYFRMAEARMVDTDKKILQTSIGKIDYDYLVLAAGATTNFFGNKNIEEWAIPMKTVPEAMGLRNALLSNFERALTCATEEERQELLNIVIVGGGATGVEIAGALSEMKRYVIPYDYPDMDFSLMHIYLIEAGDRLLAGMSQDSSRKAYDFLKSMGVDVQFGKMVTDYRDHKVIMKDGTEIPTRTFLWVSGIRANAMQASATTTRDVVSASRLTSSTAFPDWMACLPLATSVCRLPMPLTPTDTRRWHRWQYSRQRILPRTSSESTKVRTTALLQPSSTTTSAQWQLSAATRLW